MSLTLITEWYEDPARQDELRSCLVRNAANPHINEVRLFGTSSALATAPSSPKIRPCPGSGRLTFAELFAAKPVGLCAVANADIYFDDTLRLLTPAAIGEHVFCLTRWDDTAAGPVFYGQPNSQDAWIYRAPLAPAAAFPPGLPGCDSRLAHILAHEAKRPIANPSLSIRARHVHAKRLERASPARVDPPYLHVEPCYLHELPRRPQ